MEIINDIGEKKRKRYKDDKPFFMYLAFQVIISYYRQLSADNNIKNDKIRTSFLNICGK